MNKFIEKCSSFSFVKHRMIFFIISICLVITGLAGLVLMPFGITLFNFDLDFVGGVTMEYELNVNVTRDIQERVVDIVNDAAGVTANVTTAGNSGTAVSIKTIEIDSEAREAVDSALREEYGDDIVLNTSDYVSASVGNDLKKSAFIAAAIAGVLILLYISIRFEFKSGIAAILCLIHDILVILSFFIIFQIPMNMTFIAAMLSIIGYSINATIVVFDRVRENYKRAGGVGNFGDIVDKSIWQTMMRSIGTTVTTLLPIIFILIMGVTSIRIFAIPLLVGIICGGYSSVCIAGNLWNLMKGKKNKPMKAK